MTIKQIQHLLLFLGYDPGAADGIDGGKTQAAVKEFQGEYGDLAVDGKAGAQTCTALRKAVAGGWERPKDDGESTAGNAVNFWGEIQHFKREEFACKCGKCGGFPAEPAEATVRALDEIRKRLGVPVTISSGIRCKAHNSTVGGVANSQHLTGLAADLHSNATPARMKEVAEEVLAGGGGIGLYSWGIHVDTRAVKARWNG